MMRSIQFLGRVLLFCAFVGAVQAQVELNLTSDYNKYLLYEPVTGALQIRNVSGREITVEADEVQFFGKIFEHQHLPKLRAFDRDEQITLAAGETVRLPINFTRLFRIRDSGPYTFGCRMNFYGRMISTPLAYVDIEPGVEVRRLQTVADGRGPPEHRELKLISMYRKGKNHLFLSLQDPVKRLSYGVYELGPLLSHGTPRLEVSDNNVVHVLHRSAPAQYTHSKFTLNGTPIERGVFDAEGGEPEVRRDADGTLSITGGRVETPGEQRIRPFTLD